MLQHLLGADYTLEIQLEEYANTLHTAEDGFCCESVSGMCMDDCDSQFLFCLRPASFDQSSEDCPLSCYSTGVIGGDSITFPIGELDDGVLNPLVFNGSRWPVSRLYVTNHAMIIQLFPFCDCRGQSNCISEWMMLTRVCYTCHPMIPMMNE